MSNQHGENLLQAAAEEMMTFVGIDEHAATREGDPQLQGVFDGDERVVGAVPDVELSGGVGGPEPPAA